ncbi:hypothetical protein [Streptomyces griseus]|uniref:hypothetical protein n=1 Tax=Streptomyces griseus TaxID=1911 RepID=UPI000564DDB1|nr:hypothetical protein [Streptomyces griseus]
MIRPGPAVRCAGRLLCWTLGVAMLAAATEEVLSPAAGWWRAAWPVPWYLVPAWTLLWAALRAWEKRGRGHGRPTDEDVPADYDQAA